MEKTALQQSFFCGISSHWNKMYDLDSIVQLSYLNNGTSKDRNLGLGAKKIQKDDRKDGGSEQ